MNEKNEKQISIDILKHVEDLSNEVNKMMERRARAVFRRYPVTFGLLILIGVIALHEGVKGLMETLGFLEVNPLYLLIFGLIVLTITGKLYKKLEG